MKILIIEDNAQNLYLARYLLEARGHEVHDAGDGFEGLAVARANVFDVILLDIQLPGIDGYQVAERLRQLPTCATVPIVAVTSFAMPGDREKALAAGCTGYLEKPVDPDTFADRVEAAGKGLG
jgi:two-component system cell cycle response regulator DivK